MRRSARSSLQDNMDRDRTNHIVVRPKTCERKCCHCEPRGYDLESGVTVVAQKLMFHGNTDRFSPLTVPVNRVVAIDRFWSYTGNGSDIPLRKVVLICCVRCVISILNSALPYLKGFALLWCITILLKTDKRHVNITSITATIQLPAMVLLRVRVDDTTILELQFDFFCLQSSRTQL